MGRKRRSCPIAEPDCPDVSTSARHSVRVLALERGCVSRTMTSEPIPLPKHLENIQ
jgi:hypothetical protein